MAAPTSPLLAPLNWVVDQVAARVAGRPATLRWDAAPLPIHLSASPCFTPSLRGGTAPAHRAVL